MQYKLPASSLPAAADACYVKITYLDRGYGRLGVTFKNAATQWVKPDKYTGVVLLDSGKQVTAYARYVKPSAGAFEVQIKLDKAPADPLSVFEVSEQNKPFADKHFEYLIDEAWKRPYAGPSAPGIDDHTLKNRVMVGYQGWFRTPNDPYDNGWVHWGDMYRAAFSTDMWPDVTQYPANCLDKAADVKTRSGKTAYLFSPGWPEVVRTHFAWMREHNIDGAFVQRFISHSDPHAHGDTPEWVLSNVREAANREGRIWAIEYDVSGCPDDRLLDTIRTDWSWMVDHFGIRNDPSYAHEGNKPVVFVWGMSLPTRHISVQTANSVVDYLKTDATYGGNYVIGGMPGNWRTLDADWQAHIAKYDAAQAWHSTQYAEDQAALQKLGVTYDAMAWPGFSWANLKHLPTDSKEAFNPREGGAFFQAQLSKAVEAKVDHLFIGMFDEYDEGTAIMPMSDDPPPTNRRAGVNAKFFPNANLEGNPKDTLLPQIDLPLDGSPPARGLAGSNFSARFDGEIVPAATGPYTFMMQDAEGDKANLTIGEKHLNLDKPAGAGSSKLTLPLTAGQPVVYKLEYRHGTGVGRLQLLWQSPGAPVQPVPGSALEDAWGTIHHQRGKTARLVDDSDRPRARGDDQGQFTGVREPLISSRAAFAVTS